MACSKCQQKAKARAKRSQTTTTKKSVIVKGKDGKFLRLLK